MKVGDLIKIKKCRDISDCGCFFCYNKSNRIGLVTRMDDSNIPFCWVAEFDCGEWELSSAECEVISESR
ncbi:hypothetical protein CMI47_14420 [Candidatus Pacearchaeota archaeon]|nr:hypothetical protein [Candidatus Pacearchaeota archaeon]